MATTVRNLLAQPDLRLRAVAACNDDALDRPVAWVFNSELADPTPCLQADQVLLTNGLTFALGVDDAAAGEYVSRLCRAGVQALGFATGVVHERIPSALVGACEAHGLPLFEVADRTPFVAIIRHVADMVAAEERSQLELSLNAQRAITRAALRPARLGAILRELELQLDCWVALYDASGMRVEVDGLSPVPAHLEAVVRASVGRTLRRGVPCADRLAFAHRLPHASDQLRRDAPDRLEHPAATLQTLGAGGELCGVLAVGTGVRGGSIENDLVSSVVALASIALEQSRTLGAARRQLCAGVLELLFAGTMDVASRTAERIWGRLPLEPVQVIVVPDGSASPALCWELDLSSHHQPGRVVFAERDGETVLISGGEDVDGLLSILNRHDAVAGVSSSLSWEQVARGLDEARAAADRAHAARPVVRFEALAADGILAFLDAAGVEPVAHSIVAPALGSHDPDTRALLHLAETWLRHNGAWDPAARELGMHRHTLRTRVRMLESLLDLDLTDFGDRAELWSALQFVDYPGKAVSSVGIRG